MEKKIQLGYVEKPEEGQQWDFTYSKVGGKPVWLVPKEIPTSSTVTCTRCGEIMSFLLQIYAPLSFEQSYHRVIYIFCCKKFSCVKYCPLGSFKVLRSQLPKENPYYTTKKTYDGEQYIPSFKALQLCAVSGLYGSLKCSGCKSVYYATKKHQLHHWNIGTHKKFCKQTQMINLNSEGAMQKLAEMMEDHHIMDDGILYPCNFIEFDIVTEPAANPYQSNPKTDNPIDHVDEDDDDNNDDEEKIKQNNMRIIEEYKKKTGQYDNADFNTNDWIVSEAQKDVFFQNFKKYIKEEPEQILRYYEDNTMGPLWISAQNRLREASERDREVTKGEGEGKGSGGVTKGEGSGVITKGVDDEVSGEVTKGEETTGEAGSSEESKGTAKQSESNIVPNCQYCGSERACEFQVMPQLLNYLEVESLDDPIDFGTIAVYTCKNSCNNNNNKNNNNKNNNNTKIDSSSSTQYKEEFLWPQQISTHNII